MKIKLSIAQQRIVNIFLNYEIAFIRASIHHNVEWEYVFTEPIGGFLKAPLASIKCIDPHTIRHKRPLDA